MKNLVILVLLSVILLPLNLVKANDFQDDGTRLLDSRSFNTSPGKTFTFKGVSGDINFTASGSERVEIKIYGNDAASREVTFETNNDNSGVSLLENFSNNKSSRDIRIRYEVTVPEQYGLHLSTASGDVRIGSIKGNVNYSSASGDFFIQSLRGDLKISTASGDMSMEHLEGSMKISTASGDIKCSSFKGDLSIATASGDIKMSALDSKINVSSASGDIVINYAGDNKGIELNSFSGDIDINIPGRFPSSLNINSMNGNFDISNLNFLPDKKNKNILRGEIDGGGKEVMISTMSGSIKIRKN